MDNNVALPADGGALNAAFYAAKSARDFGSQIALQYKAVSPAHLVSSFVDGLTADGDFVSISQLLGNNKVTEWLARIGSSERQLRAAVNAARRVREDAGGRCNRRRCAASTAKTP